MIEKSADAGAIDSGQIALVHLEGHATHFHLVENGHAAKRPAGIQQCRFHDVVFQPQVRRYADRGDSNRYQAYRESDHLTCNGLKEPVVHENSSPEPKLK